MGDLPDRRLEQREDDDDQQDRERPGHEADQVGQLLPQPVDRPQPDLDDAEADDEVDDTDPGQRPDARGNRLDARDVDQRRGHNRQQRHRGDVRQVEGRLPGPCRPSPDAPDDGPGDSHEDESADDAGHVGGDRPVRAGAPAPDGPEDQPPDEERRGPGVHRRFRTVAVDQLRDAAAREPALDLRAHGRRHRRPVASSSRQIATPGRAGALIAVRWLRRQDSNLRPSD